MLFWINILYQFHPHGILASHLSIKISVMWRCRYAINKFDFVLGQEIYSAENAACIKNLGVSCLSPRHFPLLHLYLYTHTLVLSDEFIFAQSANGHHRGRIFVAREINPKGEWERNNWKLLETCVNIIISITHTHRVPRWVEWVCVCCN